MIVVLMDSTTLFLACLFAISFLASEHASNAADEPPFGLNYSPAWGGDHLTVLDEGRQVQLLIDQHSGAGFNSRQTFGSGYFSMKIKIPNKNTKGILTTFYLTSVPIGQQLKYHDELDFELLGGHGKPYTLSTNVFAKDTGGREQEFHLWFDPTQDFHTYQFLWNQHQIVFLVDEIPIRVFKNNRETGVNYPSGPMHMESSLWNFTAWQGPVDWSQEPLTADYRGFGISGCVFNESDPQECYSARYFWNSDKSWNLSPAQQSVYENTRKNYMIYDYCAQKRNHFPECSNENS